MLVHPISELIYSDELKQNFMLAEIWEWRYLIASIINRPVFSRRYLLLGDSPPRLALRIG